MKTANRKKTGSRRQMSESFVTAAFLSVSGGLQDAYTYFCRGRVYANAQTGNIVLLNDYLFHGNFPEAVHYLVPLISFMCGVAAAEVLRIRFQSARRLHWRQMILLIEIGLLLFVGFLPGSFRLLLYRMKYSDAGNIRKRYYLLKLPTPKRCAEP